MHCRYSTPSTHSLLICHVHYCVSSCKLHCCFCSKKTLEIEPLAWRLASQEVPHTHMDVCCWSCRMAGSASWMTGLHIGFHSGLYTSDFMGRHMCDACIPSCCVIPCRTHCSACCHQRCILCLHASLLCDSMQDALLHLQCTLPPERVDTFTVNGVLIAATRSKQPQLLVLHQCLDILQERGLAWNATTWRQVFRLQAGFSLCFFFGHDRPIVKGIP